MKLKTFAVASALVVGAQAKANYNVTVDKGSLTVRFSNQIDEPIVSFERTEGCNATLSVARTPNKLVLTHTQDACVSGLKIHALIPLKDSVNLFHGGGFISVEDTGNLTSNVSEIQAHTQGLIATKVSAIELHGNYAPNSASFESKNKSLPAVTIKLAGGMIQFER